VRGDEADLARQLEDLREQQHAISDVLRAAARSTGLQSVLDEIVEVGRRLCDAPRPWTDATVFAPAAAVM